MKSIFDWEITKTSVSFGRKSGVTNTIYYGSEANAAFGVAYGIAHGIAANSQQLIDALEFATIATARVSLEVAIAVSFDVNTACLGGLPYGLIQSYNVFGMLEKSKSGTEKLSFDLHEISKGAFSNKE